MTVGFFILALMIGPPASGSPQSATHALPALHGFQSEFLADVDDLQDKILELANSVPAGSYGWRPAPGVRSVGEVFMHIAGSNYFLATFIGVKPPSDIPADLEQITDKPRVIAELRKSFAFTRQFIRNVSDADLDKSVTLFGRQTTRRAVCVTILNHMHEHLGQSVAYARMNGVVPPWSR